MITVDLDPEQITTWLDTYRQAVNMEIPLKDDFKIHFMQHREKILVNMRQMATHHLQFLATLMPHPGSAAELAKLKARLEQFKAWAEDDLAELEALKQEAR